MKQITYVLTNSQRDQLLLAIIATDFVSTTPGSFVEWLETQVRANRQVSMFVQFPDEITPSAH